MLFLVNQENNKQQQNTTNILKQIFEMHSQDRYFQGYLSSHKTIVAENTLHYGL